MPTLNWIGKDAVVNHDKEVPFRLLRKVKSVSVGNNSQNLIIRGDNLEGLKALMPFYHGSIKCIYIDPPYNTGKESWIYNDKVNAPKIKRWLGKTVGKESEDLCRHEKWLCMMYPRLKLLKDLLAEDGVIFISIDDNEVHNFKVLLDDLFGTKNFLATVIWKNVTDNNPTNIAVEHEYIHCYAKNREKVDSVWKSKVSNIKNSLIEVGEELINKYKNPEDLQKEYSKWFRENKKHLGKLDRYKYIDAGGIFTGSQSVHNPGKEGYRYDVIHPDTGKPCKQPLMGYRFPKNTIDKLLAEGKILFGKDENKIIELKLYVHEYLEKFPSIITLDGRLGMYDIRDLFPNQVKAFDNPKPVDLIKFILSFCTNDNDIILDSFAGSGTTGHSVLALNKEDGKNRKFILVEMEDGIAKDITAERVKRAIKKYDYKDGFEYCELDKPLFDKDGQIEKTCEFDQFATYIYFTETQTNIDPTNVSGSFIGDLNEVKYYLIYKEKGKNVLNKSFLKKLKKNDNTKVIYADKCTLDDDTLEQHNIIFKQIPYEVKIY